MSTAERHSIEADASRDEPDQIPNIPESETREEPANPESPKDTVDPQLEERRTKQLDDLLDQIRKLIPDSSEDSQVKTLRPLLSDLDGKTLDRPTGKSSWTALHVAAKHGLPVAAHMLVEKGATVDSRSPSNRTPLQVACQHRKLAVAAVLIEKGADVNTCGPRPRSPLMYASKDGFIEIVDLLFKHNADPLVTMPNKKWSALHYACWYGHRTVAERLLAKDDSNLNKRDVKNALSPLAMAVKKGHEDVVKVVLRDRDAETSADEGAPVPAESQSNTPGTSERRHHTRIRLEVPNKLGHTMLAVAAQSGYAGIFEALVKAGANTGVTNSASGETLLMHICRSGHLDVAQKLFDLRDNILMDAADHNKETALHKASSGGHVSLVKLLIDKGATVNVKDKHSGTPLHRACEQGHLDVVRTLLQHGADATGRNSGAKNALHIACSASAKGAPVKDSQEPDTGSNDNTNTQTAPSSDAFEEIIAILLSKGCNPFIEDITQKTAFHYALPEDGESTTLNFLLNGAKKHYFSSPSRDSAAEIRVLLWAIGQNQRHEIVKVILSQQQPSAEDSPETIPPGSQEWGVIEWAAFRGYPWVLFPLLAEAVRSATPRTLRRALSIAEEALRKQSRRDMDSDAASDGGARPGISTIEVNRQTVRDLLLYPPFTSFSTQGIKLQPPTRPKDRQKLLQAWTASIIQFRVPKAGTSSFLRRDRSVWDVIYGEGPRKIITDEQKKLSHLLEQLKTTSDAGKALVNKSGHLDHDSRDTTFGWVHLPATNVSCIYCHATKSLTN
jgi:ankyrin repeat protein